MRMFAPNALVVGDEVFAIDAANGTPNSPAAAEAYEQAIMEMRTQILGTPFGKQWLEITGNNKEPIVIVPTNETSEAVAQTFPNITSHPDRLADSLASGVQGRGTGRGTPIRLKFNPQAHVGGLCGPSGAALLPMPTRRPCKFCGTRNPRYSVPCCIRLLGSIPLAICPEQPSPRHT